MEFIGYVASVFIGIVLGLLGGGGSILAIPILVYLFALEPVRASAYSLFIVGITSWIGFIPKYREGYVNLRTGIIFGIPSIIAIFSTRKWIVPALPDVLFQSGSFTLTKRLLLLGLFAVLMTLAAWPMIRKRNLKASKPGQFRTSLIIVQGLFIGFLTGLVGAGGGFIIIPALMFLTGLPFKKAVGTSLLIIALNSSIGFLGDALNYSIDWSFLLVITLLSASGILFGNWLSLHLDKHLLKVSFGWLILIMGFYILFREAF